jgi:hypothetical protein
MARLKAQIVHWRLLMEKTIQGPHEEEAFLVALEQEALTGLTASLESDDATAQTRPRPAKNFRH